MSARGRIVHVQAGKVLLAAASLLAGVGVIHAQDSFGSASRQAPAPAYPRQQPPPPPNRQVPRPYQQPQPPPRAGGASETADLGVKPTAQLRPTEQLHAPTPTSIPGGKLIATQQLLQALQGGQGGQGGPMLLHAFPSPQHLPGAIPVVPAGQGGRFDDAVQRDLGQYLQQATGGDTSRMLVFYCQGVQCWASYNASLRAIRLGYRNVHWYRGGLDAWQQARLPIQDASQQQGRPQSSPQGRR